MSNRSQHLRVALIQGGRIVEDRTFPPRGSITVGSAPDCTFLVPMADVPTRAKVFEHTRQGVTLHFTSESDGKVSLDGGAEKLLSEFTSSTVELGPRARGRIAVGEVSLLFQFVTPGTKPAPAPLPKGAKGLVAQIDRSFLVVLAVSLAAHFAGVGWISAQPVPEERDLSLEELETDRFAAVIMPLPKKKETPVPEATATPEKNETPKTPSEVAKRPQRTTPQRPAVDPRKLGLAGIIGSKGAGDKDSAFGDILKDSTIGDVADAMRDAGGIKVADMDDAMRSKRRGNESGETSTIELPGTDGVKEVKLSERGPSKVPGNDKGEGTVDTGPVKSGPEVPEEELGRWLRARKSAVQSCYERELKRQPSLAGRMVIRFDITPRGRVDKVSFEDDTLHSPAVQVCISSMMRSWVLPFQPEDDAPVSLPFVFMSGKS
ncbi:MAG: AgmX/PglI C-terminal domain-containing protein [Archangium sp.]